MDSLLRGESWAGYVGELRYWRLAGLTLGPFLGAVGATFGRSGAIGLLARLVVPVGALVQTFVLQPGLASSSRPAVVWRWRSSRRPHSRASAWSSSFS
jgi:hypothetical protein